VTTLRLEVDLPTLFAKQGWSAGNEGLPTREDIASLVGAMASDLDDDPAATVIQAHRFAVIKDPTFPSTYTVTVIVGDIDRSGDSD
jgi:hypothetical protein